MSDSRRPRNGRRCARRTKVGARQGHPSAHQQRTLTSARIEPSEAAARRALARQLERAAAHAERSTQLTAAEQTQEGPAPTTRPFGTLSAARRAGGGMLPFLLALLVVFVTVVYLMCASQPAYQHPFLLGRIDRLWHLVTPQAVDQ